MNIAIIIARILLGLIFVVFGANKFIGFLPKPPLEGAAGQFMGAMIQTRYLLVVATFEVAGGLLLWTGHYAPLGLTLLGPVIVNILAFHIFMARSRAANVVTAVVAALALLLLWQYREHFAGLVKPAFSLSLPIGNGEKP